MYIVKYFLSDGSSFTMDFENFQLAISYLIELSKNEDFSIMQATIKDKELNYYIQN